MRGVEKEQITSDKQSNISLVNSVAYRNGVAAGYESLQAWSFLSRWTDGFDGGCNKEQGSFGYREGGHDLTTRAHAHSHSLHSVLVRRRVRRQFWVGTTRADRHLYPGNRPRPMSMQGMPETIHSNYSSPSPSCWLLSALCESGSARPDRSLLALAPSSWRSGLNRQQPRKATKTHIDLHRTAGYRFSRTHK